MAEENDVVAPVGGDESLREVLNRVISPSAPAIEPVTAGEGDCVACANNGKVSKLKDNVCPTCGFVKTNY